MPEKEVVLTKTDLSDLVTAAIKAEKEPTVAEQRKIDKENKEFEAAQAARAALGKQALEERANKLALQKICSHTHSNGTSHCVYIQEPSGPGYLICQLNQCKIRPEPKPEKNFDATAIYDTATFNRIFQSLNTNHGDILG